MTTAIREQLLAAIYARLKTVAGVSAANVYRNHAKAVPGGQSSNYPLILMFDGGHKPPLEESGVQFYNMAFVVHGHVYASTNDGLGPALSELYASILEAFYTDPSFGGLAVDLQEGIFERIENDRTEGGNTVSAFSLEMTINYQTRVYQPRVQY